MSENKLNQLLSFLDMNDIYADIHDLMILDDESLNRIICCDSKYGILISLKEEIECAKERQKKGFMNEWEEEMFPGIFDTFIKRK